MINKNCLPALCLGLVLWSTLTRASDLSVSPSFFEIEKPPGQTIQETVTVFNPAAEAISVSLYVGDFWFDAKGARTFPKPGTTPYSAAGWAGLPQTTAEIPAKSNLAIPFSFAIPESAKGSGYATLFVEKGAPGGKKKAAKTEGAVGIALRIAVPILYQRPESEPVQIALHDFSLSKPSNFKPLVLRFALLNEESTYIFPEGEITLVDAASKKFIAKAEIKKEKVVLPTQKGVFELPLAMEPKAGKYEGVVSLFYGKNQSKVHAFEFSLP